MAEVETTFVVSRKRTRPSLRADVSASFKSPGAAASHYRLLLDPAGDAVHLGSHGCFPLLYVLTPNHASHLHLAFGKPDHGRGTPFHVIVSGSPA